MSDFDSILARARKLAAMADPANGGGAGECDNASRMLAAHLQRYGLTLEGCQAQQVRRRELEVCSMRRADRPGLDAKLRLLAVNLFWYVVGDSSRAVFYRKGEVWRPQSGLKPDKPFRVWVVVVDCTDIEYDDWRSCFHHYAPHYLDSEAELRDNIKAMQKALRAMTGVFMNKHKILPPDAPTSRRRPSIADLIVAQLARQSVKGEGWTRPAGKLQQEGFLLT